MAVRYLILTIVILLTALTLSAAAAEDEGNVGEKIQEAITMFVGGSSRERVEAAKGLAEFAPEDLITYGAWEPFTKILKEKDSPHVQQAVVNALGKQGGEANEYSRKKIVDLLIETIEDENLHSVVRAEAVLTVGLLMPDDTHKRKLVGKYLEKHLDAKDSTLWKTIMKTLTLWEWDLGDRIWKDVTNDDPEIRSPAIRSIKNQIVLKNLKFEPLKAKSLLNIVNNEQKDKDIRIDLINLLAIAVKNGSEIPALTGTLDKIIKNGRNNQVILAAVDAIGKTGNPNLIKLLVGVYDEHKRNEEQGDVMIRSTACATATDFFALLTKYEGYFIRYKANYEKLSNMLLEALAKDKSNLVKQEAAYALGNMTSRKFDRRKPVATLIDMIAIADESMTETILNSLRFLTQQDFGMDIDAWRKWYKANQKDLKAK